MAGDRQVADGIARERALLAGLRDHADVIVDTSQLAPRDFGRQIGDLYAGARRTGLTVFVQSFSYRHGIPRDADLVFDMRFLRNPYYVAELRDLTGLNEAIGDYIHSDPDFAAIDADLSKLCQRLLPRYAGEGKSYLTIAFGCTGGRHRSVYMAERMAKAASDWGFSVSTRHRNWRTKITQRKISRSRNDRHRARHTWSPGDRFLAALEHVVGPQEQIATICIGPDDDMEQRRRDILEAVEQTNDGGGVALLTDMFGGTPSNLAISIMNQADIEVIAGVNLPMLIKLASVRGEQSLADAAATAQESGRQYINVASALLAEQE